MSICSNVVLKFYFIKFGAEQIYGKPKKKYKMLRLSDLFKDKKKISIILEKDIRRNWKWIWIKS